MERVAVFADREMLPASPCVSPPLRWKSCYDKASTTRAELLEAGVAGSGAVGSGGEGAGGEFGFDIACQKAACGVIVFEEGVRVAQSQPADE